MPHTPRSGPHAPIPGGEYQAPRLTPEQLLALLIGDQGSDGDRGADPAMLAEQRYEADLMAGTRHYEADLAAAVTREGDLLSSRASRYGSRVAAQATRYGADLDYQMGLKELDVNWAEVGISRDRVEIERQMAKVQEGELAEVERSNRITEAQRARGQALEAASNASQAYMEGMRLSDQRRLSAFQETRALLPYMVDPSQEFQGGLEPGGPLAGALAGLGLGFTPQRVPTTRLDPMSLATAPTDAQIGSGLLTRLDQMQAIAPAPGPGAIA